LSSVSFNNSTKGAQDLLAALPSPPICRWCDDQAKPGPEAKPGFKDYLSDSSQTRKRAQQSDKSDTTDTLVRDEVKRDAGSETQKSEQNDKADSSNETQEGSKQDSDQSSKDKQATDQSPGEKQEKAQAEQSSDEAESQAVDREASAQLNVADAKVTDQPKAQSQAKATQQQIDQTQVKQASISEKQAGQGQTNPSNLAVNAPLSNQGQATSGPVAQVDASATVQPVMPQGEAAQNNSGDTRGDSKAATTNAATNATAFTNTNAAATTAFTIPDQAGGESRLPINTTTITQSTDAARQAQAQAMAQPSAATDDNDSLNSARLTRGLANAVQQRGGAVTLRLTPPEMGTVRIQMQITGTNVSASFHAESASAQTLLTTQLAQLRSSLESKGMSVERLTVQPMASTTASQNSNQSQNQSDTQQQSQSQQQNAGDGRSRGQYSGDSSRQQSSDQQQHDGSAKQGRRGFFDRLHDAAGEQAA